MSVTGGGGRSAGSSLCSFASASAASRLSRTTRCAASATVSGSGRRASATAYAAQIYTLRRTKLDSSTHSKILYQMLHHAA